MTKTKNFQEKQLRWPKPWLQGLTSKMTKIRSFKEEWARWLKQGISRKNEQNDSRKNNKRVKTKKLQGKMNKVTRTKSFEKERLRLGMLFCEPMSMSLWTWWNLFLNIFWWHGQNMPKIFLTTLDKIFSNVIKCFATCKWINDTWMSFLDEKIQKYVICCTSLDNIGG
jgi:hypothetical protein